LVSYETVGRWSATGLRMRRTRTGDKWHLDEVFLKINGIHIIYGAQWIRKVSSLIFSSSRSAIDSQRCDFCASCCVQWYVDPA
jgi:hypothetical protein